WGFQAHISIEIREMRVAVWALSLVAHAPIEIRQPRAEIRVIRERALGRVVRSHSFQSIPWTGSQLCNSAPEPTPSVSRNGTGRLILNHEAVTDCLLKTCSISNDTTMTLLSCKRTLSAPPS